MLSAPHPGGGGGVALVPGLRSSVQGGQRGAAGHLGRQLCSGPRARREGDGAEDQGTVFRAGSGLCHMQRGAETAAGRGVLCRTLF